MPALERVRVYASLVRLSHTVFALPFALSALVLSRAQHHVPLTPARVAAIVLAVAAARTAAMGWNRLVDRDLDARNPRTASREIPAGKVSPGAALWLVIVSAVLFAGAAAVLGPAPGLLALPVLGVLLGYSHAKRFTWACHLWLGLALALAPGGAWIAVGAAPSWGIAALMVGVMSWVAGFDVIYSLPDRDFDVSHDVHSIPARFGLAGAIRGARVLHVVTVLAFATAGVLMQRGVAYMAAVALTTALLVYEHTLVRADDLSRVDKAFFDMNGYVSAGFFALTLLDEVLR
ncbi:MAG: UbiA-like polyprenyltransferase [Deltaproteobacteria bacterium]